MVVFDQEAPLDPGVETWTVAFDPTIAERTCCRAGGRPQQRHPRGSGDLVAFCDDDDEWLPDKVREQVAALGRSAALTSVTGIIVCTPSSDVPRPPQPRT